MQPRQSSSCLQHLAAVLDAGSHIHTLGANLQAAARVREGRQVRQGESRFVFGE